MKIDTNHSPMLFVVTVTKYHYVVARHARDAVQAVQDAHYDGAHASDYEGGPATAKQLERHNCAGAEPFVETSLPEEIQWEPKTCADWVRF